MDRIKVAVIGPGNIGSDLMYKIFRSKYLEMAMMAGIVESEGIRRAKSKGVKTTIEGVDGVVREDDIRIAFDATSASAHLKFNGPKLKEKGIVSIDLTPAAIGPYCVPVVNLDQLQQEPDINMVTCGGQATIPVVYAVSQVAGAAYAEIVACISSKSAGPGTRANMDEFTETTSKALEVVGGADKGKAIIVLNPAEPPLMMTNTISVKVKDTSVGFDKIREAIEKMVDEVRTYVPGYKLRVPPTMEGDRVTAIVQVEGQADFLPAYSGNLDIINSAAVAAAEKIAERMLREGRNG
ncbi:MAG TPA: acetaldehyde dehydrogenase (acetylating) [Candidatus Mediterraneibacter pullicola]|uniref:Acetaldehyde dehydrogenase n=1 Tax=Candidatus Mediterraneibacter pullicola TaxID=2838682 RepID=A0A9D2HBD5_9FIRM|nr:acetaldehyde dehydrogenase (acetylating) [Candidatus Mediterraneibacter pullicola]